MSFSEAVKSGFRNYAKFEGVAKRSEYWWWQLFANLVALPYLIAVNSGAAILGGILAVVLGGPILLPTLAVEVRRLRDIGYSWKLMFLKLIPYVGNLIVLLMCIRESGSATRSRLAKAASSQVGDVAPVIKAVEKQSRTSGVADTKVQVTSANFCPSCGAAVAGTNYCSQCGVKLS